MPDNAPAKAVTEKRHGRAVSRAVIAIALLLIGGAVAISMLGHGFFSRQDNMSLPKAGEAPRNGKEVNTPSVPLKHSEEARTPTSVVKKPGPEPETLTKKEEPIPLPSSAETTMTVAGKALQKPAPQIPTRPSSPVEAPRSEELIPGLDLQAIVWSEDPQGSSAMINGRIVRLGEEVEGFTVDEIGRNYVSLKSGLRSGRLRMIGAR